jgi:hypothetical protein
MAAARFTASCTIFVQVSHRMYLRSSVSGAGFGFFGIPYSPIICALARAMANRNAEGRITEGRITEGRITEGRITEGRITE